MVKTKGDIVSVQAKKAWSIIAVLHHRTHFSPVFFSFATFLLPTFLLFQCLRHCSLCSEFASL